MADDPQRPRPKAPIAASDIDRALQDGAARDRRLRRALRTIEHGMERDPQSLARVLRSWMNSG